MEEEAPSSSSSQSQSQHHPKDHTGDSRMEIHAPPLQEDSSAIWDWGDLLDFTVVDDDLSAPWDSGQTSNEPLQQPTTTLVPGESETPPARGESPDAGRVRKRDPRLTCSNFLAGRVPCACPEVDEMMMELEEEESGHGKKRARTVRVGAGVARCQVPTCGADIRELKGYHRRHRVCLRCANASTVVLDGETKRYCQQCGKFHLLSDFDEGKRSCRRKLERHNNRRRRKPTDSKVANGNESQGDIQIEDINCDGEAGEDSLQFSSQLVEKESLLESEGGHVSTISAPDSKDTHSDGFASGEAQIDGQKYNPKHSLSPSYYDNKSAYSSMCPTGRISFKLYDWNPAEFPRRLRHQIFQWLANMPVELEGYIRPGCTILTVFVAMPQFMWMKVFEDPIAYVHDFIVSPGRMLCGRGNVLVYLNNMIFHVVKNGTSVIKAKVEVQAPRLHYVHPTCFEAGKPMEFVACGSNLLQPKFRFLISFSGKYLAYDYYHESSHFQSGEGTECSFDHQLYRIHVPHTEANNFGPVFIEVENEAGLSNFIPVIIGDKETCLEMKMIEQRLDASLFSEGSDCSTIGSLSDSCEVSTLRQKSFSEVVLDIAWLLKRPGSESFQQIMTASKIQRFNSLLNFLISTQSTAILERILKNLKIIMNNTKSSSGYNSNSDADLRLLEKYMNYAHEIFRQKMNEAGGLGLHSKNLMPEEDFVSQSCFKANVHSTVPFSSQDMEIMVNGKSVMVGSSTNKTSETVPLLNKESVIEANIVKEWPRKPSSRSSSGKFFSCRSTGPFLVFRPSLYMIAIVTVCLGICAVLFHPSKVGEFAVSIRRCLLGKF
ncbi:squamosa promoter-binding-like protein 7 isoform X1 [Ziziphus jujuba]|uniref:Squamosa promoter-binding-like protein 7 isoform X1 n=1 Tax=Ziziphus jujuba TaxID=326968 RepID=A0A6P4AIC6_ZIZJJ|nr:squamosa promoter-binding-like protein 7 isoform X1 [Ziziphus jujuba]